jgi:hypothetical protein
VDMALANRHVDWLGAGPAERAQARGGISLALVHISHQARGVTGVGALDVEYIQGIEEGLLRRELFVADVQQ